MFGCSELFFGRWKSLSVAFWYIAIQRPVVYSDIGKKDRFNMWGMRQCCQLEFYRLIGQRINLKTCAYILSLFGLLVLSGCSFLPSSGPLSSEVASLDSKDEIDGVNFQLLNIDRNAVNALASYKPLGLSKSFPGRVFKPKHVIGVGDVLSVVVWEPGQEGLFSSAATGGRAQLGPFLVDQEGRISVPYVGWVTAKGRTLADLRWAILQGLQEKAVDPQVVVSLQENRSRAVSVNGAVRAPGVFPLPLDGARILDMIAVAGGAIQSVKETQITFIRGDKQGKQNLQTLYESPAENIYVRPRDQIFLTHEPETYTAFGAVVRVNEYPITGGNVTLAEALGRAGGLNDFRANTKGLFIFRNEDADVVRTLKPDIEIFSETVPVIYRLDLRQNGAYFNAQGFKMRDNDVLYVANSYATELQKFINLLSGITQPGVSAATLQNALD